MRSDTAMPRAVAEYRASQYNANVARADQTFSSVFADVPDTTTLRSLTPRELGARWVKGADPRHFFVGPGCPHPQGAEHESSRTRASVIGAVYQGDTAFVLHRFNEGTEYRQMNPDAGPLMATLIRQGDSWLIDPHEMLLHHRAYSFGGCQPGAVRPPHHEPPH